MLRRLFTFSWIKLTVLVAVGVAVLLAATLTTGNSGTGHRPDPHPSTTATAPHTPSPPVATPTRTAISAPPTTPPPLPPTTLAPTALPTGTSPAHDMAMRHTTIKTPPRATAPPERSYKRPKIPSTGSPRTYAKSALSASQYSCLDSIITRESGWRVNAANPSSGAYGLPQANPGSKMASTGADWRTNGVTQIRWAISYVDSRYGSACSAWSFWRSHHYY